MQRVLDLDLDAFIFGKVNDRPSDGPRLDDEEYPPWSLDQVVGFLEVNCGLTTRLPGLPSSTTASCSTAGATPSTAACSKPHSM